MSTSNGPRETPMDDRRQTQRPQATHDTAARTECYARIRDFTRSRLLNYYRQYPERIADARGKDNQDLVLSNLRGILDILDEYAIFERGTLTYADETSSQRRGD